MLHSYAFPRSCPFSNRSDPSFLFVLSFPVRQNSPYSPWYSPFFFPITTYIYIHTCTRIYTLTITVYSPETYPPLLRPFPGSSLCVRVCREIFTGVSAGLLGTRFLVFRIRGGKLSGGCACIFVRRAGSRVWWVAPRETYERLLFLLASLSVSPSKSLRLHFSVLPFSVCLFFLFQTFLWSNFCPSRKKELRV